MSVKIDKNVPIPPPARNSKFKYPWDEMEIGDSFVYEGNYTSASSQVVAAGYRLAPKKFSYRRLDEQVRIWRIK